MAAYTDTALAALCQSLLPVASSSPSDLGYWAGRGSLGLDSQLLCFIATIILIAWRSAEMGNKQMLVAGALACLTLVAFIVVGLTVAKLDARVSCMVLNMFQLLVLAGLLIHRQLRVMSRF